MAELLLSLPSEAETRDDPRSYTAFQARTIHIPLQRAVLREPTASSKTQDHGIVSFLQEPSAFLAASLTGWDRRPTYPKDRGAVGHEFMRTLLKHYEGGADGDTFVTTRLTGRRKGSTSQAETVVDIYEAYWADLARPSNTLVSFFWAFVQLVLHLGSLSRLAIDSGAAENPEGIWWLLRRVQRYAVRVIQIFIPVLNLILLIAGFSVLPEQFAARDCPFWLPVAGGLALGIIAYLMVGRSARWPIPNVPWLWVAIALVFGAVGAGLARLPLVYDFSSARSLAAIELWFLGGFLLYYVLNNYERIRKGTKWLGMTLYVLAFIVFARNLSLASGHTAPLSRAALWTMEWILGTLRLSWAVLFIFAIAAIFLGSRAWRSLEKGSGAQARARAAIRTSRLALALPTLFLLVGVMFLWGGLFHWATRSPIWRMPLFDQIFEPNLPPDGQWMEGLLLPAPKDLPGILRPIARQAGSVVCCMLNTPENPDWPSPKGPTAAPANCCLLDAENIPHMFLSQPAKVDTSSQKRELTANNYLEGALDWSLGPGLVFMLLLMFLAFLLLASWVLPSAVTEKFRLRGENKAPRDSNNQRSLQLGKWNSVGLDSISIVTFFFCCAIFLVPSVFGLWWWLDKNSAALAKFGYLTDGLVLFLHKNSEALVKFGYLTDGIVMWSAGITASLTVLGLIVRNFSSILGIVLDVDNYLRTSPEEDTPRAQIVERYVSLLRHIANDGVAEGNGYTSVVIVAHSLGALISADLLRFLHEEKSDIALSRLGYGPPEEKGGKAERIPIRLFTMGNPLRQLLNRFFPYLYAWVREKPDNGLKPLPPANLIRPSSIPADALPDPSELGVECWVSAYRSGDYVGRSLWLEEWYGRNQKGPVGGTSNDSVLIVGQAPPALHPRSEMCIGAGAHTRYWDDTAPDIARQLDLLI
jgi:hypothetical protein